MPTLAIDAQNTFSAALLMGSAPKQKYQGTPGEIATNAQGMPQYQVQVAVTYLAEPGRKVQSEVITVTIAAPADPADGITPGSPVMFDRLRAGVTEPEARDGGRVRGGRMWFGADGIRSAHAAPARKVDAA